MSIPYQVMKSTTNMIARNPSAAASVMLFGLGFMLVAGNALYSQPGEHPAPIYGVQDQMVTKSLVTPVRVESQPMENITHGMLTQPISLQNIPVPTVNPQRTVSVAAHSSLVRDVQGLLMQIGLYEGSIDGIYGPATKRAIVSYQQNAGILPDGEASFGLLTNLKSVYAVTKIQKEASILQQQQPSLQPQQQDFQQQQSEIQPISQPNMLVLDTHLVTKIQAGLRDNFGDDTIDVDGKIGNQTRASIKKFQSRFKLEETGELDDITIQKLVTTGIVNSI